METYQTGKPAPATAMYEFVGHVQENSSCQPNGEERKIPLVAGENFLKCRHCGNDAYWKS